MKEYKYFAMLDSKNNIKGLFMAVSAPTPKNTKHTVIEITVETFVQLHGGW